MAKKFKEDKIIYCESVLTSEGEQVSSKTVFIGQSEPEYVKLYVDCLFHVKGLQNGLSPIFLAFLPYMSYAENQGGQIIYTNKALKREISKKLNIKPDTVDKALTTFVKAGIFRRIDLGTFQVNPNIVGKGEWKDIKNIRATFDFVKKEVVADIVNGEKEKVSETEN